MVEEKQNATDRTEEKSFAELLEERPPDPGWLKPGEKVEAAIVKITPEWVFLDLGGKSEGYLDVRELLDGEGNVKVKEGDVISAYFLSSRQNEKLFTTRVGTGEAGRAYLEDAWRNGIPVEGTVDKEVKGGFEIRIAGSVRGFCPFSQMGLTRVEDTKALQGRTLSFKILEYGEKGRNIILSNRALLEEERRKEKESLKASLSEGMTVAGKVVSILDFGAFVDIGGIQGLLPASEVSWDRSADIRDQLTIGKEIDVTIIRLDLNKDRITLSLKKNLPDPWEEVGRKYPEGSVHMGRIARLTKFGAFVTIGPGVDGLVHVSKLGGGKRISHPKDAVTEGQLLEVKVEAVDSGKKRVSLVPVGADRAEAKPDREEDYRSYLSTGTRSMGKLGDVLKAGRLKKKG
jgi:small subunit ribosomal protein S1